LQADYATMVEDRPITSAECRPSVIFGQNWPTQQSRGLFATAVLLVGYSDVWNRQHSDLCSFAYSECLLFIIIVYSLLLCGEPRRRPHIVVGP